MGCGPKITSEWLQNQLHLSLKYLDNSLVFRISNDSEFLNECTFSLFTGKEELSHLWLFGRGGFVWEEDGTELQGMVSFNSSCSYLRVVSGKKHVVSDSFIVIFSFSDAWDKY